MMQPLDVAIPKRLESERLYLRSFQPGDGEWYYAAGQRNRSHLSEYEAGNMILEAKSSAEAEDIVRDLAAIWEKGKNFFLAGFEKEHDEFVVQIYIGEVNAELPEYEIGYFVDQEHEGRGYVTEAVRAALGFCFEALSAHRVSLECDDTNVRSRRVAERCGFVKEGHRRENKKHADGSFTGTMYYGLLRAEFEAVQSSNASCAG
jgi:[ribosomal protein S5]-alanine N-acetyltransferase